MKENDLEKIIDEVFKHYGKKKITKKDFIEYFKNQKGMSKEEIDKLWAEAYSTTLIDVEIETPGLSGKPQVTDEDIYLEYLTPEEREIVKIEEEIFDEYFEEEVIPKIEREAELLKPKKRRRKTNKSQ